MEKVCFFTFESRVDVLTFCMSKPLWLACLRAREGVEAFVEAGWRQLVVG